jgi:hypothetical protein
VRLQLGIILETSDQLSPQNPERYSLLDVPFSEVLADETLVVFGSHMRKQLIGAKERFMAELDVSLLERLIRKVGDPTHLAHGVRSVPGLD